MDNEEQRALKARVEYLETKVQALERHLGLSSSGFRPVPPPPPRIEPIRLPPGPYVGRPPTATPFTPVPPPVRPQQQPGPRLDYEIGAKILPKVGAMAMLAGFGFLVSMAVNRGWITPAMLFGFVCTVCAVFIGVGFRIREEREQFGQILMAIGSGALYMNFAAGHVFQHLYSGEVLVVLCLTLSLVVIGGSWWLGSLAFLVLGSLGGFGAALMPLDEGKAPISLILHLAVLVASLVVAMRHKSLLGTVLLYVLGMLASIPLALSPAILHGRYLAPSMEFGLTAALCVLAYGFCFAKTAWDPQAVFPSVALLIGGFASLAAGQFGNDGLYPSFGLSIVVGVCALGLRTTLLRYRLWLGAGAVFCWVAPFAWNALQAATVLGTLALVTGLLGIAIKWRGFSLLSGVGIVLSTFAYLSAFGEKAPPWGQEAALLGILIAASLGWGRATWLTSRDRSQPWDPYVLNAVGIAAGLGFVRLTYLLLLTFHLAPESVALLAGLTALCALLCGVSLVSQRLDLAVLSVASFVFAGLVYADALSTAFPFGWEVSCVLALLALTFLVSRTVWSAIGGRDGSTSAVVLQSTAIVSGCAFARLAYLMLWVQHVATQNFDAVFGLAAVSLVLSYFALRFGKAGIGGVPVVFALSSGAFYVAAVQSNAPAGWEVAANVALLLAWLMSLIGLRQAGASVAILAATGVLGVWVLMSRLGVVALGAAGVGQTTALTVTWLALAAVLMAGGFLRDLVELRYASFALMGMTGLKVVLVDLAQVDPAIRVGLLMGLGAVMLGGGYWTIRRERDLTRRV